MEDDPDYTPLYKSPGPFIVLILLGLFFLGLFLGGFYWKVYVFPTLNGPWEVSTPGKYLVMGAFFLFSFAAFGAVTPLLRYKPGYLIISFFSGAILLLIGNLVLF